MQVKGRADYTIQNVKWGYICTFITDIAAFILRTVLIRIMGVDYAGINGLFTNILGVLSFAELGIGTALNFSLYKPAAEHDMEKLKSLMQLYKNAYRLIAAVIAAAGLLMLPFLGYLVKDPGNVGDIRIYYGIFLFNTVTSYFVSYKYSLVNAMQENYVFSILNMITRIVTSAAQMVILLVMRDYLTCLLAGAVIDVFHKVWTSRYLNRHYPILADKNVSPLDETETEEIKKNVAALIWHKVGEVCVHQTDHIIISAFVNIAAVGKVSYYTSILDAGGKVLGVALHAASASLGNAISSVNEKRRYELFKAYRFAAFWLYGYTSIGMFFMLSKLVQLFAGPDIRISEFIVFLIVLNFYMIGHRITVNNMKAAGGVFKEDRFVALLQAGVNLTVSLFLAERIGLAGVYIGTIVQGALSNVIKPVIIYRVMFHRHFGGYFADSAKYIAVIAAASLPCGWVDHIWFHQLSIAGFVSEAVIISLIVNTVFLLFFGRTQEFRYLWNILFRRKVRTGA
jgi:O-antigen/teichoic acid export membrane protein